MPGTVLAMIFPLLMAFTAVYDLLTMKIPNWISVALLAGFAVCAVATGMPFVSLAWHVGVMVGVLVITFVLFIPGWIGGGDAKVAPAICLWLGVAGVVDFLVLSALLGGVLTLLILAFRYLVPSGMLILPAWLARLHDKSVGAPYGIAFAIGGMLTYTNSSVYIQLTTG